LVWEGLSIQAYILTAPSNFIVEMEIGCAGVVCASRRDFLTDEFVEGERWISESNTLLFRVSRITACCVPLLLLLDICQEVSMA
jgi:hypothetical protein